MPGKQTEILQDNKTHSHSHDFKNEIKEIEGRLNHSKGLNTSFINESNTVNDIAIDPNSTQYREHFIPDSLKKDTPLIVEEKIEAAAEDLRQNQIFQRQQAYELHEREILQQATQYREAGIIQQGMTSQFVGERALGSQIVGERALGSQIVDERVVESHVVDEHVTAGARIVSQELRTQEAKVYEEALQSTVETEIIKKVTTPIQRTVVTPVEQKIMVPVEKTIVTNVEQTVITPVEKTIMTQVPEKIIEQVQQIITVNETRTIVVPVQKTIMVPVERTVMRNVPQTIVENVEKTVVTPVTQKFITPVEQTVVKNVSQTVVTPVTQTFVSHEGGLQQSQYIQQGQNVVQQGNIQQGSQELLNQKMSNLTVNGPRRSPMKNL